MGPGLDGDQGVAAALWRRPRLQLSLLLAGPVGWLVIAYLGSLAVLFVAAFWQLDTFTGQVVHDYGLHNFQTLFENDVYRTIVLRTVADRRGGDGDRRAAGVPDRVLHGQGRAAGARGRCWSSRCVMPLWSSYLVKVYAWRIILAEDGILNWALDPFGLQRAGLRQRRHVAGLLLPVAAVHDPADLRRASSGSRTRCSTRRVTSAAAPG